jgi:hypothetical protein
MLIDNNFAAKYFKQNYKHKHYDEAMDEYYHVSFHFDGFFRKPYGGNLEQENPYFNRLIYAMRPKETISFKDWRADNFVPENKIPCFKVLNTLKKGVRSEDWSIDYSKSLKPKNIKEGEQLEVYTERKFPMFKSVENWLYSYSLKKMIIDPNGFIVVMPKNYDYEVTEYKQPYPFIVDSKNVIDYKNGNYFVFLSDRKCEYYSGDTLRNDGKIITIITENEIWEAEQRGTESGFELLLKMNHNINELPAWQLGGSIVKHSGDYTLYESFIAPMLPSLDKAAREMSDLDAEVIQHIHSTMWRMDGQDCNSCAGIGKIPSKSGEVIKCPTCDGDGKYRKSPEKEIVMKVESLSTVNMPIPPAGYISKPTDIVKVQDERIKNHIINGLSSIGMDFLIPLAQSGIAKAYDREEANNFVYSVYYHVVENILNRVYFFCNEYRNSELVPNYDERQNMLPKIAVPQRFDIFSEGVVMAQLTAAKQAKVSPIITDGLELDLVSKSFYNNPEMRDKIFSVMQCDPLPGLTVMEKSDLKLSNAITNEDFVLSTYIQSFVENAIEEYPPSEKGTGFLSMKREEKLKILYDYAKKKLEEINPGKAALKGVIGENGGG